MRRISAGFIVLLFFIQSGGPIRAASRVIALTGAPAVGENDGVTFARFGIPTLNRFGQTAFLAGVAGPGIVVGDDLGLWSGGKGGTLRVVRGGIPVPNDPTALFGGLGNPILDANGDAAFLAEIKFPGGTPPKETVVVTGSPTGVVPLIRRGDEAPGLAGLTFNAFSQRVRHNEVGQSAFAATTLGPDVTSTNDGVMYVEDSFGELRLVAREGDSVPGTAEGVTFSLLTQFDNVLNGVGQLTFQASIAGPGVGVENGRGIWSEGGGALHLVVRTGDQAPGAPAGSNFTGFLATGLQANDRGHVAFIGSSKATRFPLTIDDRGIWSDRTGELAAVALSYQPALGIGNGAILTSIREIAFNHADEIAYIGIHGQSVLTSSDYGVWSEGLGGPRLVAKEGDTAPGVTDGAIFSAFQALAMNRWGQSAFYGTLVGAGVTTSNDNGVWAESIDGTLRLLVREGDAIEIGPGDVRTVKGNGLFAGSAGQDGRESGFNDRGQFVTYTEFTDGSVAILLWDDVVALPGDFNADGAVDAADYTVWRNRLGTAFVASDYDLWRANYGETIEVGSGSNSASVPEPSGCWPFALSIAVALAAARRIRCDDV